MPPAVEREPAPAAPESKTPAPPPPAAPAPRPVSAPAPPPAAPPRPTGPAPASPSVRRLARELGLDISAVSGTGPGGRITESDLKVHVRRAAASGRAAPTGSAPAPAGSPDLPDFSRWGEIERADMSTVRRVTAESTARSWAQIPHVTQSDKADITHLEEFLRKNADRVKNAGGKLTVTAVLLKVMGEGLRRFPRFNASLDPANRQIIYKHYVHIGVAVDTDHGLLVPVLRDVDRKNIVTLAVELADLAERARGRRVAPDELEGGTFTISNQGGIGGTDFTPLVLWPQVAILGVSRAAIEPRYIEREFRPRTILPLALSYDHRAVDGADAARFLRWVCDVLESPFAMFLE
ncbi:MAG TPA: 2-oxo acid dehydrogenase subunit E2 [candidate division Zixibacteria bacterium]|nr:2-oxo acid dehydrogenase subunit E2 [candidate division Zixibacteria bacterium]